MIRINDTGNLIPARLHGFQFVLTHGKVAFEEHWQRTANYAWNDLKLQAHIEHDNYGVLAGFENLLIIDADDAEVVDRVKNSSIANTFTVNSSPGKFHFYYLCPDYNRGIIALKKDGANTGHLKWKNSYVVGPGSIHPDTKKPYEVVNDVPIMQISASQIADLFPESAERIVTNIESVAKGVSEGNRNQSAFIMSLHFMRMGLVETEAFNALRQWNSMNKPPLDNDELSRTFGSAKNYVTEHYSFISYKDAAGKTFPIPRDFSEFYNIRQTERKSLVGRYVPERGLVMVIGRAGEHKSFMVMDMAFAVVSGSKWLGEFETTKCEVLWIDEENGEFEIARRAGLLEETSRDYSGFHWLSMQGLSLTDQITIAHLHSYLAQHPAIRLIVLDSFRRVAAIDENDSKEVNNFLNNGLKPLITELGITIIALHHLRKRDKKTRDDILDMEDARGSGDIGAMADSVLLVRTRREDTKQIVLHHAKSRVALQTPTQNILVVSKMDENGKETHMGFVCEGASDARKTQEEKAANIILNGWEAITSMDHRFKLRKEIISSMVIYGLNEDAIDRSLKLLRASGDLEYWQDKAGKYSKVINQAKIQLSQKASATLKGDAEAEEVSFMEGGKPQDEGSSSTGTASPHPGHAEVQKPKNIDDNLSTSTTSENNDSGSGENQIATCECGRQNVPLNEWGSRRLCNKCIDEMRNGNYKDDYGDNG